MDVEALSVGIRVGSIEGGDDGSGEGGDYGSGEGGDDGSGEGGCDGHTEVPSAQHQSAMYAITASLSPPSQALETLAYAQLAETCPGEKQQGK